MRSNDSIYSANYTKMEKNKENLQSINSGRSLSLNINPWIMVWRMDAGDGCPLSQVINVIIETKFQLYKGLVEGRTLGWHKTTNFLEH